MTGEPDDTPASGRAWRFAVAAAVLLALVASTGAAWATGGLRPTPKPKPVEPGVAIDQGRFRSRIIKAVARPGRVDIVFEVTSLDRKTTTVSDYMLNAVALDLPLADQIGFASAFGDGETQLLHPGTTRTLTLRSESMPTAPASYRVLLYKFDYRADFFYGFKEWKSERVGKDPRGSAFAEVTLPVQRGR